MLEVELNLFGYQVLRPMVRPNLRTTELLISNGSFSPGAKHVSFLIALSFTVINIQYKSFHTCNAFVKPSCSLRKPLLFIYVALFARLPFRPGSEVWMWKNLLSMKREKFSEFQILISDPARNINFCDLGFQKRIWSEWKRPGSLRAHGIVDSKTCRDDEHTGAYWKSNSKL